MTESSKQRPPCAERSHGGDTAGSVPVRSGRIIPTFARGRAASGPLFVCWARAFGGQAQAIDPFSIAGCAAPHPSLPGIVRLACLGRPSPVLVLLGAIAGIKD